MTAGAMEHVRQLDHRRPARPHRRISCVFAMLSTVMAPVTLVADPAAPKPRATAQPPAAMPPDPPLPVDARQEAALLELVGTEFALRRTPHFILVYNTNPALLDELAGRLENTYGSIYRFAAKVGIATERPSRRLEVIFFNRREEYDRYTATLHFPGQGTYGVYYEPTNRSAFFNVYNDPPLLQLYGEIISARKNLDDLADRLKRVRGNQPIILSFGDGRQERLTKTQARRRLEKAERELKSLDARRANYSERINHTVIQHEATHQVLFNAGVHVRGGSNPKWLVEGMACLFETPPGEWGSGMSAVNQLRLKDFREAVRGDSDQRALDKYDFLAAIRTGRMLAPDQLVSNPRIFDARETDGAMTYAMTWSLTHFLQRRQPQKLAAYLKEIAGRRRGQVVTPAEELAFFERHFGKLDDNFVKIWGDYMLQLAYRAPPGL